MKLRATLKGWLYSGPARHRWQLPEKVMDVLELGEGQKVADLGAGGGYFTYRLARAVGPSGTVYAVDPDREMLEHIRDRAERKGYRQVEVVDPGSGPPELPTPVDAILTVNAFHHLPEDRTAFFAALRASLAPGGRLVVIDALPKWTRFGHATDPAEVRAVLTEAGYTDLEERDVLPKQSITVARRPTGS